jgi:hypothetical protein
MFTRLVSAAFLSCTLSTVLADDPPGLAGTWRLNRALSQDLAARIKDVAGSEHMDGGPSWATETWLPWGEKFGEPERLGVREFLLATVPVFDVLEIQIGGDEVKTVHGEAASRIFDLKRARAGSSAMTGQKVTRQARLEGETLVLESKGKDGRLREDLTLEPSRARLVYVLRLEQKRLKDPLEARLVYDRAS